MPEFNREVAYLVQANIERGGTCHILVERYDKGGLSLDNGVPVIGAGQSGQASLTLNPVQQMLPTNLWMVTMVFKETVLRTLLYQLLVDEYGLGARDAERAVDKLVSDANDPMFVVTDEEDLEPMNSVMIRSWAEKGCRGHIQVSHYQQDAWAEDGVMFQTVASQHTISGLPVQETEVPERVQVARVCWTDLRNLLIGEAMGRMHDDGDDVLDRVNQLITDLSGGEYKPPSMNEDELVDQFVSSLDSIDIDAWAKPTE